MQGVEVHTSALGILLAIIFAFFMGGLLWWMLHPPVPIGAAVAKALRGLSAARRILVPVKGMSYSDRAVELACRLGEKQKAELLLVYVIEVPLAIPLNTPLERDEAMAQEALEHSSQIVQHHGLQPVSVLKRDRTVAHGVLGVANDQMVDAVVLGLISGASLPANLWEEH